MLSYICNDITITQAMPDAEDVCDVILDMRLIIKEYKLKLDPEFHYVKYWSYHLHSWYEIHKDMTKKELVDCKSFAKKQMYDKVSEYENRGGSAGAPIPPMAILAVIYSIEKKTPFPIIRACTAMC